MQDPRTTEVKQMHQQSHNKSNPLKLQSEQPFIINRPRNSELCLYEKNGHWSQKEKLKYILFIEYFNERFMVKAKRRFNNIFDSMAIFIKTRNSHQCRSHHQKMQKEKFQIQRIINSAKAEYHPDYYKTMRQRYLSEIETIQINSNKDFNEFKQKIQMQQEKIANQRQKIAQNKRILRSTKTRTSNHIKKPKNPNNTKNQVILSPETHPKRIIQLQEANNANQNERVAEALNQISASQHQDQTNKEPTPHHQPIQSIPNLPNHTISPEPFIQPYQLLYNNLNIIKDLQNHHKHHTDMAYYHYNQYLTHTSFANNIQLEMMGMYQSMMKGNFSS